MPLKGQEEIKVNLPYEETSIDKAPLGGHQSEPIKYTPNGKLVDPTEVSIESNPNSNLPE